MKILISADGGKNIGLGHIMRMIVLGKELRKTNEVIFICRNSKGGKYSAGIEKVRENEFEVFEISEKNYLQDIISIQKEYKGNVIITDSYDVNEEYFTTLTQYFTLSGYVDDINKFNMNVDFLINQNINALFMDYNKTTKSNTKLFLGTKYSMIREEFRVASYEKIIKDEVQDILVTLGGMDDNYNTKKILDFIKETKQNIHVVLGNAFDRSLIKAIFELSNNYQNIFPYENVNMSELMKKCDISISACGSTLYELCVMKIPSIGLTLADNQEAVANTMKNMELLFEIFDIQELNSEKLVNSLNDLINNKTIRERIMNNQKKVINISGAHDLVKEIEMLAYSKGIV